MTRMNGGNIGNCLYKGQKLKAFPIVNITHGNGK